MTDPEFLKEAYGTTDALGIRIAAQSQYAINRRDLFDTMTEWALSQKEPTNVLDVGMGTGKWYHSIRRLTAPSVHYVGLDAAPAMVELMAKQITLDPQARVSAGDAMALPFTANQFDWVGLHFMLYHVPQPQLALQEAWRVTKPGGLLMTLAHGDDSLSALWALHREALKHCLNRDLDSIAHSYTLDSGHHLFPNPSQVFVVRQPSGLRFPTMESAIAYYGSGFWRRGLSSVEWDNQAIRTCLQQFVAKSITQRINTTGYFDMPGTAGWLWAKKPNT